MKPNRRKAQNDHQRQKNVAGRSHDELAENDQRRFFTMLEFYRRQGEQPCVLCRTESDIIGVYLYPAAYGRRIGRTKPGALFYPICADCVATREESEVEEKAVADYQACQRSIQ